MRLRDQAEAVIRSWDLYETERGAVPVIDYDCAPTAHAQITPAGSRLEVARSLAELAQEARRLGDEVIVRRLQADLAYLRAQLGHHQPLSEYVSETQGCDATGWTRAYIAHRRAIAVREFDDAGIAWGKETLRDLVDLEGAIAIDDAGDAIRDAASEFEPLVRRATGTTASYNLTIEMVDRHEYWSFWLDGAGQDVRLRLNRRNAQFTKARARQFALHEVLGHALQYASLAERASRSDVPWVRVFSVHAQYQVLFEGLAQAMPLFVVPDDAAVRLRVRLDHYLQLVRAEIHTSLDAGVDVLDVAERARRLVPFWDDAELSDLFADRGPNPNLRSYLWSYPAGIDWFVNLAESDSPAKEEVLHAAYRQPLAPSELAELWPAGPSIGGG